MRSRSGPFGIRKGFGVYHDLVALPDEGRNRNLEPVAQHRRLEAVGGGLPRDYGFGFLDGAGDLLRQCYVQRLFAVEFDDDDHPLLQERQPIPQKVGIQMNLIEHLGVHEDQVLAIPVKELVVPLLQSYPLNPVGGTEAFIQL